VIWLVTNIHGLQCVSRGDTEAEAIEGAKAWFASNVVYVGPGLPPAPDPRFAAVGLRAQLVLL
jgi:hypothetical protein